MDGLQKRIKPVANVRMLSGGDLSEPALPSPRVQIGWEIRKCEVASRLRASKKNNQETVCSDVVKWYHTTLPRLKCEFDSRHRDCDQEIARMW